MMTNNDTLRNVRQFLILTGILEVICSFMVMYEFREEKLMVGVLILMFGLTRIYIGLDMQRLRNGTL